ncbi:unnamed protein product, partial [Musa hybrid cultivar]
YNNWISGIQELRGRYETKTSRRFLTTWASPPPDSKRPLLDYNQCPQILQRPQQHEHAKG